MMNRVGLASASLLGSLSLAPGLHAQPTPPTAPPPAAPSAALPAASAPDPVAPNVPAEPPTPTPIPTTPPPNASKSETASTDRFGLVGTAPPAVDDNEIDRQWRAASLHRGSSLSGSSGLLHVAEAGAGAPGTFRLAVTGAYFSGSGFLCNSDRPCPVFGNEAPNSEDDITRTAGYLSASATLLPFLEVYGSYHNLSTSNSRGRPQLLQALGDADLGVKGFLPHSPNGIFSFGGEAQLLLLNGSGGVGLDGASTSFVLRGLATLDLNNHLQAADRIPLRVHANLAYKFDNSGKIVRDIEDTPAPGGRGAPISRVERFGLGINRVDFLQLGLGAEFDNDFVRPFAEFTIDIPANRQDYTCVVREAAANGDRCLGLDQGAKTSPSRVTLGARGFPWPDHALSLLAAFDIGTGATSHFVQEISPELPWNFYFGLGYAFDTVAPKPVIERIEAPPPPPPPVVVRANVVEGLVVEKNTTNAIADAIVKYDGRPITGMVTGPDGIFRTVDLEPGTYTFNVTAPAYHDGQCIATVLTETPSPSSSPAPVGPAVAPGQPAPMALPVPANPNAAPSTTTHAGPNVVKVQCELEALPKVGSVVGSVTDPETSLPVDGAHIEVTDRLNRKLELRADANGAFRFENVPPGPLKFSVDAPGYFTAVAEVSVRAREESQARMLLNKRPTQPNVVVAGKEIKLKKQVHFQHDSADILPDSQAILEELADVMNKRADIKNVEVQGHTDNTGAAPYNLRLSQSRAQAVVDALAVLGIDSSRMVAKGYGQEKPLAPNSTEANRAKNRRVQVIITAQGK